MNESEKTCTNGEITVTWKPGVCIHSAKCVQGLGEVFKVIARPGINMDGSETNGIIKGWTNALPARLVISGMKKPAELQGDPWP